MENNFQEIMAQRTDDELIIIVSTERLKYQQPAIEAAENEIAKRNISNTIIDELKEKVLIENFTKETIAGYTTNLKNRATNQIIDFITIAILYKFVNYSLFILLGTPEEEVVVLSFIISYFGYYIYMESKFQQTLGKFYTKTKVVTLNGEKPKLINIVGRTFLRTIPYDPISFSSSKNGFHDSLSKTTVIDIKS
jgi:uncharacterized RDD family membrane protein YckC